VTALASESIGAVLGTFGAIFVAQRRLRAENISVEPVKWREKVRAFVRKRPA